MDEDVKAFTVEFFKNLKCNLSWEGSILIVENVPKSFEDIYGRNSPYRLCFDLDLLGADYVIRESPIFLAMAKYLEGEGKITILKIDFDMDPGEEILKIPELKNCRVENITRKNRNNFFSRFTFVTTFNYLRERERIINEVYVYEGKVVEGDLTGYKVLEGISKEASSVNVERDYLAARESLDELLKDKVDSVGVELGKGLEVEIAEIRNYYNNLLEELKGDINKRIEELKELEIRIGYSREEEARVLRARLDRLRHELVLRGDEESKDKILKEQELNLKEAMKKYSPDVESKLLNTTVIYYPVFSFNLFLKGENNAGRFVETSFDPLTGKLEGFSCDVCSKEVNEMNLCSNGHTVCGDCFNKCGECSKAYCDKCLKKSCSACGKDLCKDCSKMCRGCLSIVCSNHMRVDCVSGEDRCVRCLRACMRCHGLSTQGNFGEALDGSKVCQKCIASERRSKVMKKVFEN